MRSRRYSISSSLRKRGQLRRPLKGNSMRGSAAKSASKKSAFAELGFKKTIDALCEEVVGLYLSDSVPWVIGYSGGKDSSAVLQLVWLAIKSIPEEKRTKVIHVISTDT